MSVVKCIKCKRVYAIPQTINKENWICQNCVHNYKDTECESSEVKV